MANVSKENVAAHNHNISIVTPKTGRRGREGAGGESHANNTATSIRSRVYKLLLSVVHDYIHVGATRTQFNNFTTDGVDEVKFLGPCWDHVEVKLFVFNAFFFFGGGTGGGVI